MSTYSPCPLCGAEVADRPDTDYRISSLPTPDCLNSCRVLFPVEWQFARWDQLVGEIEDHLRGLQPTG